MIKRTFARLSLVLAAMLALSSCDGFLEPQSDGRFARDGSLTFIRVSPDAPPLDTTEVSFWIVRGQERSAQISYGGLDGYEAKCIRFVVPADAPLRHPDGSVFEPGDSVLATIRVVDSELFLFEFDPAGLVLNPSHPARMEVRFAWTADDVNGDGMIDDADQAALRDAQIWGQESISERWSPIRSRRINGFQEVHAEVRRFTKYAFATD